MEIVGALFQGLINAIAAGGLAVVLIAATAWAAFHRM